MKQCLNMNETTESTRIINRHKARLLCNLEDINCPKVYKDAIISAFNWMRSDLQLITRNEGNTYNDTQDENRFNR